MRICLLTTQDLDAVPFAEDDWPCDPRPFLPDADWHVAILKGAACGRAVAALVRKGFDLFFNLCDGAADEDSPGINVITTLERLRVPFTGSTSVFYEPSRTKMKRVCKQLGLDTPAHVMVRRAADVERAANKLRFPLFVKHPSSYASIDLSRASRVVTPAGLRRQVRKMMTRHGGALVEEFIEGTECTVLVAENADDPQSPVAYPPVQYRFPAGESFKHADMKWVDYNDMSADSVTDQTLAAKLREELPHAFLSGSTARGLAAATFAWIEAGARFCSRSTRTVASTTRPQTPAERTCASRWIPAAMSGLRNDSWPPRCAVIARFASGNLRVSRERELGKDSFVVTHRGRSRRLGEML